MVVKKTLKGAKAKGEDGNPPGSPPGSRPEPYSPSPGQIKRPQVTQSLDSWPLKKKSKYEKEVTLHVLLPNATTFKQKVQAGRFHTVVALRDFIKTNASDLQLQPAPAFGPPRPVKWGDATLNDARGHVINDDESLIKEMKAAQMGSTQKILVIDGHERSLHIDPDCWDVTPKPEILRTPVGYRMETALADQIDNSLQAVWHNPKGCKRVVRVDLSSDQITIFDTGPGMDASSENYIQNWGTVGGSKHREDHHMALGGNPPFLRPYFGKYGVGATYGSLHLGGRATVSSKTKQSKLVTTLVLEQAELERRHQEEPALRNWNALGEFRAMTKRELELAPHGTFTEIVITKLKKEYCLADDEQKYWNVPNLRRILKEIYYPYIQSEQESEDGSSSTTTFPVTMEVNGENLAGVEKCETAVLKLHTCTAEPFVLDINMTRKIDEGDKRENVRGKPMDAANVHEAKCRVTCYYYPNLKGKESLETAAEEINELDHSSSMTFDNLNRVAIRWLGRLLPEMTWLKFPFMAVASKKEHKSGLRLWGRRVRAFVDTDAGFYPVQSKSELDRGQPFVLALQHISNSFDKTPAAGVKISIKHGEKELKQSQLAETYFKWLLEMHKRFDEEFVFADEPNYIFNHEDCLKDLGVGNCLILHKHMKDDKNDWKINNASPLYLKLPKGPGLKADRYVTLEYFFYGAAEDDRGVQFLCRGIDTDESEGCQITTLEDGNLFFKLKCSQWFPATMLNTAMHLNDAEWKKKKEDISNKLPGFVEILKEEDTKTFELREKFPVNCSRFEAGYSLPKEFLVVVRPRKGFGATSKQGMIVSDAMGMKLEVKHCSCPNRKACQKRLAVRGKEISFKGVALSQNDDVHSRVVGNLKAKSTTAKDGVKGLYVFSTESTEINRLIKDGTYTFRFTVESDKYKDVRAAVSSIEIFPSTITAKWTFCCHPDLCTISQHESTRDDEPLIIRLEEPICSVFLQKYDEFDNRQGFQKPMELDVECVTLEGQPLEMRTKVQSTVVAGTEQGQRLQLKNILFEKGSLNESGSREGALLRVCLADEQKPEIKCKVLPGALATVEVKEGHMHPPVVNESMEFLHRLRPGEAIRKLTLQSFDKFGNKVEKGQKLCVVLEGAEFQDDCGNERFTNEDGTVQLGGLLKVACQYNSKGSIAFYSGIKLISTISFETARRHLVVDQVPVEAYVGREVEGVSVKMVDEEGNVDELVNGYNQPITVDWITGVAFPFVRGECILPSFLMPEKAGAWKGTVSFSPDPSLSITLTVQLKLKTASSIGPANQDKQIFTAECGVSFSLPFKVYDDQQKPARLSNSWSESIKLSVEAKDINSDRSSPVDCIDVKMSMLDGIPTYEAQIVVSSPAGMYKMTLTDTFGTLEGKAEVFCKLQHGPIAQLVVVRSDGTILQSCAETEVASVSGIEAKRRGPIPELEVKLLDSLGNVCSGCERRTVRMRLLEYPDWKPLVTDIKKGTGKLKCLALDVPVRRYQVSIELDTSQEEMSSVEEPTGHIQAQFLLTVHNGNYPSGLTVFGPDPVRLTLTEEEIQYCPTLTVLIQSADGQRLESSPTVGVKVSGDNFPGSGPTYGSRVERSDQEIESRTFLNGDQGLSSNPILARYEFTEVRAPDQAGIYTMEFFVLDSDIPSLSQILVVRHGPPKRIIILPKIAGQEINVLKVNIVDAHENVCKTLSGVHICVQLTLSEAFTVIPDLKLCFLINKCTTVVKEGHGDFGVLRVTKGIQGFYSLKMIPVHGDGEKILQFLLPAEVTVSIIRGKPNLGLLQLCDQLRSFQTNHDCGSRLAKSIREVKHKQTDLQSVEGDIKKLEVELMLQESAQNQIKAYQCASNDKEILEMEIRQPKRDDQCVKQDLTNLAQNNYTAPLMFLEACDDTGWFSPQHLGDFVGLAAMLARVEDHSLNRVLVEYLGVHSLCLIVTRTQLGIHALEAYNSSGNVDESRGLHSFARSRGYNIHGNYNVLALSDVTPFRITGRSAVNMKHHQKLLYMDPPTLPHSTQLQVPEGFLGYAVNLLYLKPEHLQMRVKTRAGIVGLRESLWFHILRYLQVYDTRGNMTSAKDRLEKFEGGAISLDGGMIRTNNFQQLGIRRNNSPICFGLVPIEERLSSGGLMPLPRLAFERCRQSAEINTSIKCKRKELHSLIAYRDAVTGQVNELKLSLKQDEIEEQENRKSSEQIAAQMAKVQRAAQKAGSGDLITKHDGSDSEDSDSERMRIFMM